VKTPFKSAIITNCINGMKVALITASYTSKTNSGLGLLDYLSEVEHALGRKVCIPFTFLMKQRNLYSASLK
jgi:hypothetical protein